MPDTEGMTTETYYEMSQRFHAYKRRLRELGVPIPEDATVYSLADLVESAERHALTVSRPS